MHNIIIFILLYMHNKFVIDEKNLQNISLTVEPISV